MGDEDEQEPCRIISKAELYAGAGHAAGEDQARQRVQTFEDMNPEQMGRVLGRSLTGLPPDAAFWAAAGRLGFDPQTGTGIPQGPRFQVLACALVFRADGSFAFVYQLSVQDETGGGDAWSPFAARMTVVDPVAAYALIDWFREAGIAQAYRHALVDDAAIAAAVADALAADGMDDASVRTQREQALAKVGLDDAGVAALRRPVVEAALLAAGLDESAVTLRRAKALDEAGLDDEFIKRRIARVLSRNNLDDRSIRNRRAEALRKAGLGEPHT